MGTSVARLAEASPPVPALATGVRWRILALLLAFSFMSWFNRISMPVAYDERIRFDLDISEKEIGWVYSALLFAYMLCMTPGGWFAGTVGMLTILLAAFRVTSPPAAVEMPPRLGLTP